jgi:endonuclease/exonuclease/phosphatase family metal-dependent hydrolase
MPRVSSLPLTVILFAGVGLGACSDGDDRPGLPVNVFTRNLYLGTDFTALALVKSLEELPQVAAGMWANVQESNFPERAKVLAAQIVAAAPDLVALQEVTLYRRQSPSDYQPGAAPNATEIELDFLATLMAELDAAGGAYTVAGVAENADVELPVADPGGQIDLRVTDRDVILARDGVETTGFVQTNYPTKFSLNVVGVPVTLVRSTSRVEANVGGAAFTFGNGHLEVQSLATVHAAQAQELVDTWSDVADPALLLGDFNSDPGDAEYDLIMKDFVDAWSRAGSGQGSTCCVDLTDANATAGERIDLVLYRGSVKPKTIEVIGADAATGRTPGGLWPSDHFGVRATLELRQ